MAAIHAALPSRTATGGAAASRSDVSLDVRVEAGVRRTPGRPDRSSYAVAASKRSPVSIQSMRVLGRDVPGKQGADHERPQPAVDLGQPEGRGVAREHDVAAHRQADPAGEAHPLHPRDDRHRALAHRDHEPRQAAAPLVLLEAGRVVGHHREVGTRAEDPLAGGRHDHHAGRSSAAAPDDRGQQRLHHRRPTARCAGSSRSIVSRRNRTGDLDHGVLDSRSPPHLSIKPVS